MNARLLRPKAARLLADADASAYIAAVEQADQQSLEQAVKTAIFEFVTGCKADGIWTPIKRCCILMGARTLSGALTPLVGAAPTNNGPFVSGDYNRKTGLVGNGASKYLATGYLNAAEGQNNFHGAVYLSAIQASNTDMLFGAGATGAGDTIFGKLSTSDTTLFTRNRNASSNTNANRYGVGFMGTARSSSSEYTVRGSGQTDTVSIASQTPSAITFDIYRRNTTPGGEVYTAARLAFYSLGGSLTLATLDSRVTTLYNAIGAAI